MNLTDIRVLKKILEKYGIRPRRRLGHNFLISDAVLQQIVKTADLRKGENVLEIGAGVGTLTQVLLKSKVKVTAIEIDKKLVKILKEICGRFENLQVVNLDALDYFDCHSEAKPKNFTNQNERSFVPKTQDDGMSYKVLGNLPYQITSPIIRKILFQEHLPKSIVFLVQKEAAERICAPPGDSKRGFLSVLVKLYSRPKIIDFVSKDNFYPIPKVDSAILKLNPKSEIRNSKENRRLIQVIQAGFSQKRKKLRNSLSAGLQKEPSEIDLILNNLQIGSSLRAEDLSVKDWRMITSVVD